MHLSNAYSVFPKQFLKLSPSPIPVPPLNHLPIVKLKPSMLKVALRPFLNLSFLELASDIAQNTLTCAHARQALHVLPAIRMFERVSGCVCAKRVVCVRVCR